MRIKVPIAVLDARESKKGLFWAFEILVFAALFFASTLAEAVILVPAQLVLLARDPAYLEAAEAKDLDALADASARAAGSDAYQVTALFATAVMILIVALFCKIAQKRGLAGLGFVKEGAWASYAKGALLGFAIFSAAMTICVMTGSVRLSAARPSASPLLLLLFAAGYMVQGMAEEVLCRGYFMVSLGRRYSMEAAVLVSAVAFGALHALNPGVAPMAIFNIILFGIFASLCFIRTENIWLAGALHSAWNFSQGNIYGIKVSGLSTDCSLFSAAMTEGKDLVHGGAFGLEGGLAVTIALAAGIAFLCLSKKGENGAVIERGTR